MGPAACRRVGRAQWPGPTLDAMEVPSKKPGTYADIAALPDNVVGELLNGELFVSPRPAGGHTRAASVLGGKLGGRFDWGGGGGPEGWWIHDEPELHFGPEVLVPDLAGWRRSRMLQPTNAPFVTLAPDWICEVISRSTAWVDRERKLPLYARESVRHAWLVDPLAQTLEVFRNEERRWFLLYTFSRDERVRAEPFEELELDLESLWLPGQALTTADPEEG